MINFRYFEVIYSLRIGNGGHSAVLASCPSGLLNRRICGLLMPTQICLQQKLHIFSKCYTQYSNHFLRFKISKGRYEGYYEGNKFENCVKYITLVKQVVGNASSLRNLKRLILINRLRS